MSLPIPDLTADDRVDDLLADCREVVGVLGELPGPLPAPRGALPVDIDAETAAALADWSPYGA